MSTEIVMPEVQAETSAIATNTSALAVLAEKLAVVSQAEMLYGTALLAQIKTVTKRSEEARKVLVKPLNDHVAMINAQFKTVTEPLNAAERTIKTKMLAYSAEVERAARAEAERLHREAQERALEEIIDLDEGGNTIAAEVALSFAAAAVAEPVRVAATATASGTATVRKTWEFEVVDFVALGDTFKQANIPAIREAVRGGARDIPGVRIFQQDSLSVRAR